jgi:molybdate transport system permease protein
MGMGAEVSGGAAHAFCGPLLLSFEVATLATGISLVVGGALAIALSRRPFFGRELLDAAITLPLVLPPTVMGYYLLTVLSRQGAVGRAFEAVFGMPLTFTRAGAVLAASIHALPLLTKSVRAALVEVDPLLVRAARSLGASEGRVLWTVSLPLCRRAILSAVVLAFARALGDFGVTLMIAGDIPGQTQTAALFIYDAVQAGRDRDAAALSAVLSALALLVLYAVGRLGERGTAQR